MKTILLIEDDPFLVDLYTTKFKEIGFEVEVATNGREGLRKMKVKKPDILLLDIVLPAINGWEILGEMKKDEGLKDLKVVILSNLTSKEEVERGLKLGADKYLIKSHYTPSEVVKEIKKILEQ
ncbi:MAG TPA: response regulator [Candidatus Nealsonbacteria bacterium]|uniref:Response regulatory domain-containing protein n=1 Tax=marine sediment metagenome TaxID=412755 RepID=A0A0F9UJG1_9ZZZZ|nr:response regulator [Candidatus Nealsonbacteria bacterium]HEB46164.1 response regulator [Candidatus Nealsonbacteria bacterium]